MSMWRVAVGGGAVSAVFLVLLPQLRPGDVVLAAVAGASVIALAHARTLLPRGSTGARAFEWWRAVPLLGYVIANTALGAGRIALLILGWKRVPAPGIVEVEIGPRSPRATAVTGLLVTISPGTVLLDVDEERGVMVFHVVGSDAAEFRGEVEKLYSDFQRYLVP